MKADPSNLTPAAPTSPPAVAGPAADIAVIGIGCRFPGQADDSRRPELALPICAMSGRRDIHCSRADVDGWREHTHGPLESLEYSGGHFFLQSQEAKLVGDIRARLDMLRRGA